MTLDANRFWNLLKERGYTFFAGVPDSTFGPAYAALSDDPEIRYVPAVREDVALGLASAAYFMGRKGGVVMQNSGVGNLVNPLTSFNLIYKVPALLVVGWRGFGGPPNDAPEHWIMGVKTPEILNMLDVPNETLDPDAPEGNIDRLVRAMDAHSIPGALLVPPGSVK